jgi:hypothetical protein
MLLAEVLAAVPLPRYPRAPSCLARLPEPPHPCLLLYGTLSYQHILPAILLATSWCVK